MGFWYFLGVLIGIGLLLYGIMQSSYKTPFRKLSVLMIGTILIGFSLYMFLPGSDDTMAEIFKL
ncbi:hypothetical protein CQS04_05395 [Chryseomicrobium excrementi]|uniref:Uncharacterized protein n=1 Tax=Chryseomicrobium excrementi TaxID=2041346 RepID=A0A2M9EZF6_9BACL|nr:hypothetical protein [Chryseomicrobium excrementi]PJK16592.1 hypothetical protein CQS04_05395 [Chryseomicrobium excrementi]